MSDPSDRPSIIATLASSAVLSALTDAERERLVADSKLISSKRGETLWLAGSAPEFVAIVATGFVKLTKNSLQGTETALELLGPGQWLGLLVAIEGTRRPANAVAVTDTWWLKVPSRTLIDVYAGNPPFKDKILQSTTQRLRKAHNMMARLSSGRVEERLAAVLMILSESYGESVDGGMRLKVPLTRQDISEMAGTTVESTIRVMSRWQKAGIIATDHQVITILKENQLFDVLQ